MLIRFFLLVRAILYVLKYFTHWFGQKCFFLSDLKRVDKVGCVYPMAAMSRLPRAEFGRNGSTLFGQQFRLRIWLILKEVILFTYNRLKTDFEKFSNWRPYP